MLKISEDIKLDFDDVLIVPQRSSLKSRSEVNLVRNFKFPHSNQIINATGIIASNLYSTGTMAIAKVLARYNCFTALHKHYSIKDLVAFFQDNKNIWQNVFYTVGTSEEDFTKLLEVKKELNDPLFPRMICIDIANGYSEILVNAIKKYRDIFSETVIMAGNVVTPNMAEEIIISGADLCKIGIGPSGFCTTRVKTGVGFPQLSAISECSHAVHGNPSGHICGDGGVTSAGDVCKAMCGGADFVMIGGMFSGTEECEGEWETKWESPYGKVKTHLKCYGMASREAQEKFNGGLKSYRSAEGRSVLVPYKGQVSEVIEDILGGIRSCCTMIGASKIKDMPKCAQFIRVNDTHNKVFEK